MADAVTPRRRRGGNGQVRIEDVALRAGVAPITVSRALRTPDKVSQEARQRIEQAIAAVGLAGLEDRPIGQLSGGQLQRARFARVILQDSPLVLLDEPYGAIDANTVRDLAALVRRWNGEGRTVISVLHDFEHVRQEYPETLLLARELVARGATAEVLSEENLRRARHLAEAQGEAHGAAICSADAHENAGHTH